MSARRDSGQPRRNNSDWSARRDDGRSPRDRDLRIIDTRGRPREDRDERNRPMNAERGRERGHSLGRNMATSPVGGSTSRFHDSRQSGGAGPVPNAPASAGTSSNGDQPATHQSLEKQLVDQQYGTYLHISKHAALKNVFTDLERELKAVTADRDEVAKSRYDDFTSSRETLNRRKDALEDKVKRCRQEMNENKSSIGKRAHEFIGTLLQLISAQGKTPTASPAHNQHLVNKSDFEVLEKKLDGRLAAYDKRLAEQQTVITAQANRISHLEADTKRRDEELSQQGLSMSTLQSENMHLHTELRLLQNRILTLESGVPETKSDIEALQATGRGLEKQATAQDTAAKTLSSGYATLKDAVERLQASHDTRSREVAAAISDQATTVDRRVQHLTELQEKGPKMQEALQGFAELQSKMQGLEGAVEAIKDGLGQLRASSAATTATAATTTTTTTSGANAMPEELGKLAADLKRLQIDHEQKMSRKEVDESMADIKNMIRNSFNGLVEKFGGFIDDHDSRLQSIETAVKETSVSRRQMDETAAPANQTSTGSAGATAQEAGAVEAKTEELVATKLKEELDLLNAHLNNTRQELERCQEGFAGLSSAFEALHQRHEDTHGATVKMKQAQQDMSDLVEVLRHAVQSLSSQFNNMSTEELCKRILRHVSMLGPQQKADELTRRLESLEKAIDAGSNKKRKMSAQTSGQGAAASGSASARSRPGPG